MEVNLNIIEDASSANLLTRQIFGFCGANILINFMDISRKYFAHRNKFKKIWVNKLPTERTHWFYGENKPRLIRNFPEMFDLNKIGLYGEQT